jgi:hypothetical protein
MFVALDVVTAWYLPADLPGLGCALTAVGNTEPHVQPGGLPPRSRRSRLLGSGNTTQADCPAGRPHEYGFGRHWSDHAVGIGGHAPARTGANWIGSCWDPG